MIGVRKILTASAIAPLGLVAPVLALTVLMGYGSTVGREAGFGSGMFLLAVVLGALSFHIFLALLYAAAALILRQVGLLTRRVLFVLGVALSLVVASWLAFESTSYLPTSEVLADFAIQAIVCLIAFTLISALWWRLATSAPTRSEA
jgi:hypothetical protein